MTKILVTVNLVRHPLGSKSISHESYLNTFRTEGEFIKYETEDAPTHIKKIFNDRYSSHSHMNLLNNKLRQLKKNVST